MLFSVVIYYSPWIFRRPNPTLKPVRVKAHITPATVKISLVINFKYINGYNSYAGIASKDGSEVHSEEIYFNGVKIPFAAYQKKNEYRFPSLDVKKYEVLNFLAHSVKDKTAKLMNNDKVKQRENLLY